MKINLGGKRALVTGSSSGIGYAIAKGLAEAGAAIVRRLAKKKTLPMSIRPALDRLISRKED